MSNKKILVIGAGLGGLSAAISLKQAGYDIEVFEKNAQIGGKLNVLTERGYTFDLGPSILTLPHIFERLFERSGKKMGDYFSIRALRPHWRNFFEDGVMLDLYPEPEKMAAELDILARKTGRNKSDIVKESLGEFLWEKRFRQMKKRLIPKAKKAGLVTDDDVFKAIS